MYNIYLHIFLIEQQVVATGMFYGHDAYFTSGWNIMDGSLVTISIIDLLMSLISESSPRITGTETETEIGSETEIGTGSGTERRAAAARRRGRSMPSRAAASKR